MTPSPAIEIRFEEMSPSDVVLLRTRNSTYEFTVEDPRLCQGAIRGGVFGECPAAATLIEPRALVTGSHLRFRIDYSLKSVMMTTSAIIGIEVRRKFIPPLESARVRPTGELAARFIEPAA